MWYISVIVSNKVVAIKMCDISAYKQWYGFESKQVINMD